MKIEMTDVVKDQLLTAMKNANKEAVRFLFMGFSKQGPLYAIQLDNIVRCATDVVVEVDSIKYILQREYQIALKDIEITCEEDKFYVTRHSRLPEAGKRADLSTPGEVTFGINPNAIMDD
ncbi:MAG: hypothetical protein RR348_02855 [Clostridia bacterium]